MNRKSLAYSSILILFLVATLLLVNRGLVRGVIQNTDIKLTTNTSQYSLGDTVTFTGTLDFASGEEVIVPQVQLRVNGPDSDTLSELDVTLPVQSVQNLDLSSSSGVTGTLTVSVQFTNVISTSGTVSGGTLPGSTLPGDICFGGTLPGGTLPGGTLPGSTLPSGGQFKGVGESANITYIIQWTPPSAPFLPGLYKGQLEVVVALVGTNDCGITRSSIAQFSLVAAPTATPTPPSGGGGGGGGGGLPPTATPSPTPTPTATPSPTPTVTPTPTATATPEATPTPAPTATPVVLQEDIDEVVDEVIELEPEQAADVIEETLVNLGAQGVADVIEELIDASGIEAVADIIEEVGIETAVQIVEALSVEDASALVAEIDTATAAEILSEMSAVESGAILDEVPTEQVTEIVQVMDESDLLNILPEMTLDRLLAIPPQALFDSLPMVAVESITFEIPPSLDLSLLGPTVARVGGFVIYTIPETGEFGWATLVGSPAFIDQILGKFTKKLKNVRIKIQELDEPPDDAPTFDVGQVVDPPLFRIDLENAEPEDLSAVHVTLKIAKSWLQENNIHKWSVRLNRLDEQLGVWVPFPAKRVREDDEVIFYTVVVPGFSLFAITGSVEVREQVFSVTDLSISPAQPQAGEDVTVTALVSNPGAVTAVYPANLWVNNTIEESKTITLEAGETRAVTFTTRRTEPGDYQVRLERLLGQFSVSAQPEPTATPTVVPPTATVTLTPAPTATARAIQPVRTPTKAATKTPTPSPSPMPTATATPSPSPTIVATPTPTGKGPPVDDDQGEDGARGALIGIILGVSVVIGIGVTGILIYARRRRLPSLNQ